MQLLALAALAWVGWAFANSKRATAGIRDAPFPAQPIGPLQAAPGTGAQTSGSAAGNRFHRTSRARCGSCRTPRTMLGTPWVPRPRHGPGPIMDPLTAGPRASAARVIGLVPGATYGTTKLVCSYKATGGNPENPGGGSGTAELTCFDEKGGAAKLKPKCFQAQTQGPPKEVPCESFEDL